MDAIALSHSVRDRSLCPWLMVVESSGLPAGQMLSLVDAEPGHAHKRVEAENLLFGTTF
jgi:hypothetical protein